MASNTTKKQMIPRYAQAGFYPYHFVCTRILPVSVVFREGQTHGCWCSAWKKLEDGTLLQWRDGAWREGNIKSRPETQIDKVI